MVPPFNTPNKMQPYLAVKRTRLNKSVLLLVVLLVVVTGGGALTVGTRQ